MHEQFSDWYASLSLGEDQGHLESRWKAIDAVAGPATKSTLELLIRLAFRTKVQMSASEVAELRTKFAGDSTAPGDEELVVLAGAALAQAMQPGHVNRALAATMVLTASCEGLRELKLPMDLVAMAATVYLQSAEQNRTRPSLDVPKAAATALDKAEVAAAVKLAADGNPAGAVQALATSLNKVISSFSKRQAAVEFAFQSYTLLQDEELDILWWLHGGFSNDFGCEFNEVPEQYRPLGIARELSALTTTVPGPTAVPTLLLRAGVGGSQNLSLVSAVQGMPFDWLDDALDGLNPGNISAVITPILFALSRRRELRGEEGWSQAWSKLAILDEAVELDTMHLAEAAYREFVLARLS